MGALTLKSFPFELRGWDIEKLESLDPTDSFGTQTRVYISKNQIIQIEPDYDSLTSNIWLSDKSRQFFDEIFENKNKKFSLKQDSWLVLIDSLLKTLYIFDHCNKNTNKKHFFIIAFENLSIEVLGIFLIILKNYSFLKIRKADSTKLKNDFESNFQLNFNLNRTKLKSSTLCLLLGTNPRYEGYFLNLTLRQRILKGNFKCFTVGSLINLTFTTEFLGSNLNIIKSITEGNNLICQDFKNAQNPILITNTELCKRIDGKNAVEILKMLNHNNIFNSTWAGVNILNSHLNESGTFKLLDVKPLSLKDLTIFSSLYLLNVDMSNITNIKKIIELKILKFNKTKLKKNKLFIDQHHRPNNNLQFFKTTKLSNYFYLPHSTFYENDETFINTEGIVKKTTKIIFKKKSKNSWQILRRIIKQFQNKLFFLNNKNNSHIFFDSNKITNFRNYINFHYNTSQDLSNINFYLTSKNKSYFFNKKLVFKKKSIKIQNTKLQYWLNDYFSGGKDNYSHNSFVMANCSKILRSENSNFF